MHTLINKTWHGRFPSKEITIGGISLGSKHPIRLQSMTNTSTINTKETVKQCLRIIEAGADFVRISTPNIRSAEALTEIKKHIRAAGKKTPLIADIHYNPKIALVAARIAEKIRINPGNYCTDASFDKHITGEKEYNKELEIIHENILPLLSVCKEYGTAIRIGTNHGSLSPRILYRYGNTAEGMVQATLEYIKIFEDYGFYNTVISLKSSSPNILIESYRQMAEALIKNKVRYPMHLGVTEAGAHDEGRIRSAAGICSLLNDGIGDTIRVSLSEKPENEIPFAKKIVHTFEKNFSITNSKMSKTPEQEKFKILNEISKKLPRKPFDYPVVISSCNEKYIKPEKEEQQYQLPDFVFCNNPVKSNNGNCLLPYSIWQKHNNKKTYPLLDIQDIDKAKKIKSALKFFLIKATDISEKQIKAICTIKDSIIILEASLETSTNEVIEVLKTIAATCSVPVILKSTTNHDDREQLIVEISKLYGYLIPEGVINGMWIEPGDSSRNHITTMLAFSLLQATGKRITTNQYLSCPTCARTSFNLTKIIGEVKEKTKHFKGLKIAVMGCVVNGPGEMADADYGLVGAGNRKIHIYKKQQIIKKNIEQKNAVGELVKLIEKS